MSAPIKIDIWSDIACPFCYLGTRKFAAGAEASGVEVEVEYHSFELSPDTPEDVTGAHAEKIAEKMGVSLAEARAMEERITETARGEGLDFDYQRMQPANTFKAHQLLHHAKAHGRQAEMKERLLRAYFTEGRHVGRVSELADLAADIGLDRDDAQQALADERYLDDVRADIRQAGELGIRGVPFFVIDGRYAVSGAQDATVFAQALTQVRAELDAAS